MQTKVQEAIKQAVAADHQRKKQTREEEEFFVQTVARHRGSHDHDREQRIAKFFGVDLNNLTAERRKSEKGLSEILDEVRSSLPPHSKREDRHFTNLAPPPGTDDPPNFPVCFFPADFCWADGSGNDCDATQAAMFLQHSSSGVGGPLGIEAFPEIATITGDLWYAFMPPFGGSLAVIAEILVTGEMVVDAANSLLTVLPSVEADARLTFRIQVHQSGMPTQSNAETVASLHCQDFPDWRKFRDDLFVEILFAQVFQNVPVVIQVSAELYARGRSDLTRATLDFRRGWGDANTGEGIRVPALCVYLTPNMIL